MISEASHILKIKVSILILHKFVYRDEQIKICKEENKMLTLLISWWLNSWWLSFHIFNLVYIMPTEYNQ